MSETPDPSVVGSEKAPNWLKVFLSKLPDLFAPEVILETDGDLGCDWDGLTASISDTGRVAWAALFGTHRSSGQFVLPDWPDQFAAVLNAYGQFQDRPTVSLPVRQERARLQALIERWRETAKEELQRASGLDSADQFTTWRSGALIRTGAYCLEQVAYELEAALGAGEPLITQEKDAFVRDREATCDWNCTRPFPHEGPCGQWHEPPALPAQKEEELPRFINPGGPTSRCRVCHYPLPCGCVAIELAKDKAPPQNVGAGEPPARPRLDEEKAVSPEGTAPQ